MQIKEKLNIFWIRNDLRIDDNFGLYEAILNSKKLNLPLVLIFHINDEQTQNLDLSGKYFFSRVKNFFDYLEDLNISIYVFQANLEVALEEITNTFTNINEVFLNFNQAYGAHQRDIFINRYFQDKQIKVFNALDKHFKEARTILNQNNQPYKVFSAYARAWFKSLNTGAKPFEINIKDLQRVSLDFPSNYKQFSLIKNFDGKKIIFDNAIEEFKQWIIVNYDQYHQLHNQAFIQTSQLSPLLANGIIGIRRVINLIPQNNLLDNQGFLWELAWRDFYNMVAYFNPDSNKQEILRQFIGLEFENNANFIQAWKNATTGYPIVDASMRQLNATGELSSRLRMVVASFLIKDLLVDWKIGEEYFSQKLIDYYASANVLNWQWCASTGIDASPYFRIFNPTLQSQKFDKNGTFIRYWLPELAQLPDKFIHEPWKMSLEEQNKFHCILGKDYPKPIVDHQVQKMKVLHLYRKN
ncbi:cryptochrome/photolyase family protein [Mycoplasmopsis sturni]|uniref:cryptochrome/photolyase family protein n=1 Tax=Mycoplasmopsis sturni TaxID=39047 RepID=UPI00068D284A|nr:deoxyribodipyrimidine photo-lyase [Mycoplasmopsis sturni]